MNDLLRTPIEPVYPNGPGTVRTVANTPLRSFRISDEVYNAAKDQAELDGVSVTEVVVQMLKAYGGK